MTDVLEKHLKPFLRWAGGKSRLTKYIKKCIPKKYNNYWEPFLGSGALFFNILPNKSYLSDLNSDLITCYKYVRDYPEQIFEQLQNHQVKNSEEYYYTIRDIYNNGTESIGQSARFIYLNKSSFNGIFRVNKLGKYNVPYGHKEPPSLPSKNNLIKISRALSNTILFIDHYRSILKNVDLQSQDFVYLDPPYPPTNVKTANFTHYTSDRFTWYDQEELADIANQLSQKGCSVMISNSDQEKIRSLFTNWNIITLPVVRWVAANGNRKKINELIITNYDLEFQQIFKEGK